jgi:magnesium and cobalt transporter
MEEKPQHPSWLEKLSQLLLREPKDREQLVESLHDARERNLLDEHALNMIEGVLQVSEMQVRDIMIPFSQTTILSTDNTLDEILSVVIESGYSRYPVINKESQEIKGILLAKDLLPYTAQKKTFLIQNILRSLFFVPESKRLNLLLQEFRLKHAHMAIVVDEYGAPAGLVTIEDILEQIVGEIEDEYDFDDEAFIKKHSERTYIIKALTPTEDFNEYFQTHFDIKQFNTIGDYIVNVFGELPKRGESITLNGFRIKILHADHKRIRLIHLRKIS